MRVIFKESLSEGRSRHNHAIRLAQEGLDRPDLVFGGLPVLLFSAHVQEVIVYGVNEARTPSAHATQQVLCHERRYIRAPQSVNNDDVGLLPSVLQAPGNLEMCIPRDGCVSGRRRRISEQL